MGRHVSPGRRTLNSGYAAHVSALKHTLLHAGLCFSLSREHRCEQGTQEMTVWLLSTLAM